MSTLPDAQPLSRLQHANLRYLIDGLSPSTTLTSDKFNLTTGRPLTNIENVAIETEFQSVVDTTLFEGVNVHNDFLFRFPHVMEVDLGRDLVIGNETEIRVTFVKEGASMQNMVGYYFYEELPSGEKIMLQNTTHENGYYYEPTVIFPHVYSVANSADTIQSGDRRLLRGNLPNGNFSNVRVGFFLLPHGWFGFTSGTYVHPDLNIHTTVDFNRQYAVRDMQLLDDKIYSVFVRWNPNETTEMLIVGFEDIVHITHDIDYNDCVLGIVANNWTNILNIDDFPVMDTPPEIVVPNNLVAIEEDGEYVCIPSNVATMAPEKTYLFERQHIFDNAADRDACHAAYAQLETDYNYGLVSDDIEGSYRFTCVKRFRPGDVNHGQAGRHDGGFKVPLLRTKFNRFLTTPLFQYQKILEKSLKNSNYVEKYRLYDIYAEEPPLIDVSTQIDKPRKPVRGDFRIIGNGVMDCQKGKSHLPFKAAKVYQVYKNTFGLEGLQINVGMDAHPTGYQLGTKNFVRWVSLIWNTSDHVVVDLGDLSIYSSLDGVLTPEADLNAFNASLTSMRVSGITYDASDIKKLVDVFRNNSNAYFRKVTAGPHEFYCIRLPNVKNNPTMLFMDRDFLFDWNEHYAELSGTYFYKQHVFQLPRLVP